MKNPIFKLPAEELDGSGLSYIPSSDANQTMSLNGYTMFSYGYSAAAKVAVVAYTNRQFSVHTFIDNQYLYLNGKLQSHYNFVRNDLLVYAVSGGVAKEYNGQIDQTILSPNVGNVQVAIYEYDRTKQNGNVKTVDILNFDLNSEYWQGSANAKNSAISNESHGVKGYENFSLLGINFTLYEALAADGSWGGYLHADQLGFFLPVSLPGMKRLSSNFKIESTQIRAPHQAQERAERIPCRFRPVSTPKVQRRFPRRTLRDTRKPSTS